MTVVYFDCEFTDLVGIEHDIKLISAGFVTADGQEFYVELPDNWRHSECNSFVHEVVLPHLDSERYGMAVPQAAAALQQWIEALGGEVSLASDAPAWDWPLVADLLGNHGCWPANLARKALAINTGNIQQEIESYFGCHPLAIRHHALWDARALASAAGKLRFA